MAMKNRRPLFTRFLLTVALACIVNSSRAEPRLHQMAIPDGLQSITFQLDLGIQKSIGNFDPANHTAEVHGSFNAWGEGITLSASPTNANVYKGELVTDASGGAPIEYKFVINKAGALTWEGNVGPVRGFGNRVVNPGESDQVLPVVYFDNLSIDPGAGVSVNFRVN